MIHPIAEIGRVQESREISPLLWDIEVIAPLIASVTRAGQFAHVRVSEGFNPFLRRPLSIGPIVGDVLRLIFHVRGEGTRLLAAKKPGDPIDLIGPLGHPIQVPDGNHPLIFLTGGIGVVPLLLFDDQLPHERERIFILGVRSQSTIPVSLAEAETRHVRWSSDDGSIGFHGNTVQLLERTVEDLGKEGVPLVIACGPGPMLRGMKKFCSEHDIPALVSLEVPMGCGVGACQSCAVPRSDGKGYFLVCKEGPIFDSRTVVLDTGELP